MRKLLIIALLAVPAFADEEVRHPFNSSVPRNGIRRVYVDIPAGEVVVRNGDESRITITGEVRRHWEGERNRQREQTMIDDIDVVIRTNGNEAVIERVYGPNAGSWTARSFRTAIKVRVDVPRGIDVQLATKYGEVRAEGDFGDFDVDLRAGEIQLRMPRASVRDVNASVRIGEVHADFGDERVNNEGIFPGATHFSNGPGRAHVNVHTSVGEVHVLLTR